MVMLYLDEEVKKGRKTVTYDLMNSTIVFVKDSTNELGFIILTSYPIVYRKVC